MPKDRRTRSSSFEQCSRASPVPYSSSTRHKHSSSSSSSHNLLEASLDVEDIKEWEEARCPVCMDHPHNAVLLLCSSYDKGCRAYMCDTSHRHSNCLDLFRKTPGSMTLEDNTMDQQQLMKLLCPLCRGGVEDWTVVEPARKYMNAKTRSCSLESCKFSGTYRELRDHARLEHPSVRPSEADPERQRDWRTMEQQRDFGDVLSTIQSALGGDEGEVSIMERGDELGGSLFPAAHLTVYFFIRVFRSGGVTSAARSLPWRTPSRGPTRSQRRRALALWGEVYSGELMSSSGRVDGDGNGDDDNDEDNNDDGSEDTSASARHVRERTRRRLRLPEDDDGL